MPASEDYGPLSALKQYLDYRPLGNDPWTNTMRGTAPAPGQGFAPAGADPVLYPTASPLVNITEGDIKRATDVGLAASGGGLKGQQIKAYHSSPHDFERFDLSKIGSGEGAQVYGHGLYFAENPAVSGQGGQYWKQFLNRFKDTPEGAAATRLQMANFDRETAARLTQEARDRYTSQPSKYLDPATVAQRQADLQRQHELLTSGQPVGPRTYEVNINADPAQMLDWDKRFFAQSPEVQDALRRSGVNPPEVTLPGQPFSPTGAEAYRLAGMERAGTRNLPTKVGGRYATEALSEAGIPGIKYLDQGSRGAGTGSSNYVVFNPSIIDIVKKYGLAGLTAPPAIAGAMNQERQP